LDYTMDPLSNNLPITWTKQLPNLRTTLLEQSIKLCSTWSSTNPMDKEDAQLLNASWTLQ
jgi:hypothetical protein